MQKEKKVIIIPILVVMLFFGLAISPGISAKADTIKEHKLTIRLNDSTGNEYKYQKLVTNAQLEEANNSVEEFIMIVDEAMEGNSPDGSEISETEWDQIVTKVETLIDLIASMVGDEFPADDTKHMINSVIYSLLGKSHYLLQQPLISIGIGVTLVPFYDYETMLGKLIKPVFIHHLIGFSATFKLNPFKLGFPCLHYGLHRVRTFFFTGLLIDFSDLGYDRIFGPQILIGYGFFTGFA